MKILVILLLFTGVAHGFVDHDTLSIKGGLIFNGDTIRGDFLYTLKNNSSEPLKTWAVIINPAVNIHSINQNGVEASVKIQHGFNYRALIIELPRPIGSDQRSSILIRFSINQQEQNKRFQISPDYVFLDARTFWFPYPNQDHLADFEISVDTPNNMYGILGGKMKHEAIILNARSITWVNELQNLSPGLSLVITRKKREKRDFLTLYTDNPKEADYIYNSLKPFWDLFKKKHQLFPTVSEINLIPSKIDNHGIAGHQNADGEFLGNIFLLDPALFNLEKPKIASITQLEYFLEPSQRLIETIIHELYHSIFPGIVTFKKVDSLFFEGLTQYLTWNLIKEVSPDWGMHLYQRTHFLLRNLRANKKNPTLLQYVYDTSALYAGLDNSEFDSFTFADTLVQKYRYSDITKKDVHDTIELFIPKSKQKDTINVFTFNQNEHYNSSLVVENSNISSVITNKEKEIPFSVPVNLVEISHTFPETWHGTFYWTTFNVTNKIPIMLKNKETWITNLPQEVSEAWIKSSLDILEKDLSDNYYAQENIGLTIAEYLNGVKESKLDMNIEKEILEKLDEWKTQGFTFKWDYTNWKDSKDFILNIYLNKEGIVDPNIILLFGTKNKNKINIYRLSHP